MVTKTSFGCFSLKHPDGNFFLRPDRILGCFHVKHDMRIPDFYNPESWQQLSEELQKDEASVKKLKENELKIQTNHHKVNVAVEKYWPEQARDKQLLSMKNQPKTEPEYVKRMSSLSDYDDENPSTFESVALPSRAPNKPTAVNLKPKYHDNNDDDGLELGEMQHTVGNFSLGVEDELVTELGDMLIGSMDDVGSLLEVQAPSSESSTFSPMETHNKKTKSKKKKNQITLKSLGITPGNGSGGTTI